MTLRRRVGPTSNDGLCDRKKEKWRRPAFDNWLVCDPGCAIRGTNDHGGRIVPSHLFLPYVNLYRRGTFETVHNCSVLEIRGLGRVLSIQLQA